MNAAIALTGARLFDGTDWHDSAALLVRNGIIEGLVDETEIGTAQVHRLDGGLLAPGFVDLQVNGGGGVMLNGAPSVETIHRICRAHAPFGTTALLPTLITDAPETTTAALAAGEAARLAGVEGFLGLHLEGPHLSVKRKGAHEARFIRPMEESDFVMLAKATADIGVLLVTVAPETVTPAQISRLANTGVSVSLGHSDADYEAAMKAFAAGAKLVTHLFNAMSPLAHREPGLVGAALQHGPGFVGLIADGIHVDPAAIAVAMRAKKGPGRLFLVTDAMATVGSDVTQFELQGRTIYRRDGCLRLADGTLAGADLDMISAVRFMHQKVNVELGEALRMASLYPAQAVGQDHRMGRIASGCDASFVHLSDDLAVRNVWIRGRHVHSDAS